jgi:hypothetical protein
VRSETVTDSLRDEVYGLWENGRISDSDVSGSVEIKRVFRELSKRSLYFLVKGVLGRDRLRPVPHKRMCAFAQRGLDDPEYRRQAGIYPRGVFKTEVRTKGVAIQATLRNPNVRMLISNQTASNASKMIREIEQHFDGSNPMMNWLFPEYIKPNDKWKPWSEDEMIIPCRTIIAGTPTIMIIGTGGRIESQHFDIIFTDDLIGEKAMESPKEMLDAIIWHDGIESLFIDPRTGIEIMSGTRWDLADLYQTVIENPLYKVVCEPAENIQTGELFFPELLDKQVLHSIKTTNYALYMSQYMNDPENPEVLEFRREWLREYMLTKTDDGPACELNGETFLIKDMDVVLAVDPAASGDIERRVIEELKKGRSQKSNNAVEVWGLHGSGTYFLLDLWTGRAVGENPEAQLARKMLEMFRRWKGYIRTGVLESFGAQAAIITVFKMLLAGTGESYPLKEAPKGSTRAKKVRVRAYLGGPAQNKQIAVRPGHDMFRYEFGKFPQSDQLDTLDAAVWAFQEIRRPNTGVEQAIANRKSRRQNERRIKMVGRAGY